MPLHRKFIGHHCRDFTPKSTGVQPAKEPWN